MCICDYLRENQPCSHQNWNSFYWPSLSHSIAIHAQSLYWSMWTGLLFLRAISWPCKTTSQAMVPIEGANLVARTWNCCHCQPGYLCSLVVWYRPSVATFPHHNYFNCVFQLPKPSSHPLYPSLPSTPPAPMLRWPKINAHLKNSQKALKSSHQLFVSLFTDKPIAN